MRFLERNHQLDDSTSASWAKYDGGKGERWSCIYMVLRNTKNFREKNKYTATKIIAAA